METYTRDDIQVAIQEERLKFDRLIEDLSEEDLTAPLLDNGWSIKDLLLHIVGWEQRLLGWITTASQGDIPQIPAPGYDWDDVDELNVQNYEQHAHRSVEDAIATYHATQSLLFMALEQLDDRSRDIVTKRWLVEKKATLHELAAEYGVSAERIRQIEANAFKRIKGQFQ